MRRILVSLTTLATLGLPACGGDRAAGASPDASVDVSVPGVDVPAETAAEASVAVDAPATVTATFRVIDAATQRGVVGRVDPGTGAEPVVMVDGAASVELPAGRPFEAVVEAAGFAPMHLHGIAGSDAFTVVSFAASRAVTRAVLRTLGLADDASTGIVVAGLDTPTLRPSVGAGARVEGMTMPGFVFDAAGMPRPGNVLLAGGPGFVSLPGVAPGLATVRVTAPAGQRCALREGGGDTAALTVQSGTVHVVSFICAPMR